MRQRQRLIDACISALHIHGPSETTVQKVVEIADLSPGIVRFYFDSKAALLVASLAYLAAQFEERVLVPVGQLKHSPVRALELLIDLYLDPDIASPRKVSVWYSFWGEASSRQEYYDICGNKDDAFAALVLELIERLIRESGAAHLEADGVALGLIGVLEVLWQSFAFQDESSIDRAAARRRSLAYLRSVFPNQFGTSPAVATLKEPGLPTAGATRWAGADDNTRPVPAWAYASSAVFAAEREQLFWPAWQVVGHEAEIATGGQYLTAELAGDRALVVRDKQGTLHALRNTCRQRPHALVSGRTGRLDGEIHCEAHNLTYGLDGRFMEGQTTGDLTPLESTVQGRLIQVRAPSTLRMAIHSAGSDVWSAFASLAPLLVQDMEAAADWKLIVEQWLEASGPQLKASGPQRHFLAPNQFVELRRDGARVLQVIPQAPGRCRIRRFEYGRARGRHKAPATDSSLRRDIELAESTQAGLANGPAEGFVPDAGPPSAPASLAEFRRQINELLSTM